MTKEDNALQSIFGGAEITLICGVFGYVLIFFLKLLLNYYFGTAQYGIIQFLMTILGFGSLIASLGVSQLVIVFIPKYIAQKKEGLLVGLKKYSWSVSIASSIIVAVILFICANSVASFFDFTSTVGILIVLLSYFLPLRVLSELLSARLVAQADPIFPSFSQQILDRLILFFGVGFCVALHKSVYWYVLFIGISYLLQFLFLLLGLIFHHHPVSSNVAGKTGNSRTGNSLTGSSLTGHSPIAAQFEIKDWVIFSLPLIFSSLIGYVFDWTDYFTVAKFFDAQTLGMYDLTYSLAGYLLFIPAVFGTLFIPVLTQLYINDKTAFLHVWAKLQVFVFVCVTAFVMVLFTFAHEFLVGLYGPIFVMTVPMLRLLVVCFLFANMFSYTQNILLMQGHTRFILGTMLLFGLLDFIVNIISAKFFGSVTGVALSTGVFLLMLKWCEWKKATKQIKLKLPVVSFVKVILLGIIGSLFAEFCFSMFHLLGNSSTYLLVSAIISSIFAILFFFVIAIKQKLVPLSELQMLRKNIVAISHELPHWHHALPRRRLSK